MSATERRSSASSRCRTAARAARPGRAADLHAVGAVERERRQDGHAQAGADRVKQRLVAEQAADDARLEAGVAAAPQDVALEPVPSSSHGRRQVLIAARAACRREHRLQLVRGERDRAQVRGVRERAVPKSATTREVDLAAGERGDAVVGLELGEVDAMPGCRGRGWPRRPITKRASRS